MTAHPMRPSIRSPLITSAALVALALVVWPLAAQEPDAAAPAAGGEVVVEDGAGDLAAAEVAIAPAVDPATDSGALNYTLMQLIEFGGWVGYVIIALSIAAVALIIDYALLLRAGIMSPVEEVAELHALVASGRAAELAGDPRPSFVGGVVAAGAVEIGRGYEAIIKAMEDRADELSGRLLRRIEYLNMIANVAPMLGLLGTVIGMVQCFNQISVAAGGADPRLLAAGIFQALMTTVMGLMVAIPAYFAFSIFRNRVDALAADASAVAEEIMAPLKPADAPLPARASA